MYIEKQSVAITTESDGTATAYSDPINGKVLQWQYVADGTAPYESTTDVTVTSETAGLTIDSKTDLSAAFAELVGNVVYFSDERIKIVLAQGGDTKTGTFHFWYE